jgi:hypothetical protein
MALTAEALLMSCPIDRASFRWALITYKYVSWRCRGGAGRALLPSVLLLSALMLMSTSAPAAEPQLTIDTPVVQLLARPSTKAVLDKHLPKLVQRLTEDQEAASFLGASSPRELAADPHVRGITDEILKALQADLLAAQKSQD